MKAQRGGKFIVLPIHNPGAGRARVVKATFRPPYRWGRDPVSFVQDARWVKNGGQKRPQNF